MELVGEGTTKFRVMCVVKRNKFAGGVVEGETEREINYCRFFSRHMSTLRMDGQKLSKVI